MKNWVIRKIEKEDNEAIAKLIRDTFDELNIPKTGTAYEDSCLDLMFEEYQKPQSAYYVVEHNQKVVGGAGVAPLQNELLNICELQKMYFLPEMRGQGAGTAIMDTCLLTARKFGFKKCYLETMPFMEAAQKLYVKAGFNFIDAPIGNTGHNSCPIWMLKDL